MSNQDVSTRTQLYWNTLIRIPSQIITFVISIFVTRILDPKDFGIMGIVMMLIGYSNLLSNFGFNQAVIQKRIHDKKLLNSIFTFDLTISLFLALIFYILSGSIADFFKTPECKEVIRVMSLVFAITSFAGIPSAMLKRDMNFKTISLFDIAQSILMSVITLVLALYDFKYWALAFGQLIPLCLITIFLCVQVRWVPRFRYNHTLMRSIFNFGMWNFINTQLGFIVKQTDKFIIGRWLGPISLGYYDKSMSIGLMPLTSVTVNINAVMFSSFSKNQDKPNVLRADFKKSLTLISIINYPIYFGLISIAPYFVHVLLGKQWIPMIVPFQIILVGCIFSIFGGLTASFNIGVGNYKVATLLDVISALIFVIVCLIILRFGLNGICISYLIYMAVLNFLLMRLAIFKMNIYWMDVIGSILPGFLGAFIMFLVLKTLSMYYLNEFTFFNLSALVVSGLIIYSLSLLINKHEMAMELRAKVVSDIGRYLKLIFKKKEYKDI